MVKGSISFSSGISINESNEMEIRGTSFANVVDHLLFGCLGAIAILIVWVSPEGNSDD